MQLHGVKELQKDQRSIAIYSNRTVTLSTQLVFSLHVCCSALMCAPFLVLLYEKNADRHLNQ